MKRITITPLGPLQSHPKLRWSFATCYRADSTHYGVSAYGRTVAEARSRLFRTTRREILNRFFSEVFVSQEVRTYTAATCRHEWHQGCGKNGVDIPC